MEDVGDVTFELRRRLTTISAECDRLITEDSEELSPDVKESIERMDDQVRQLVTLISRLETAPVSSEPIRAIDTAPDPHQPDPEELVSSNPVVLSLVEGPFAEELLAELQNANRITRMTQSPRRAIEDYLDADSSTRLVLSVQDILAHDPPAVNGALSLLTPPETTEPILGASGLLSPAADAETVFEVLDAFHNPDTPTAPIGIVRDELPADAAQLDKMITDTERPVRQVAADEPPPKDVDCILLPAAAVSEETLAQLRQPQDGKRTPVVVLADPPSGHWLPTIGGRTFVQRPPTAADFTGELLLLLDQ